MIWSDSGSSPIPTNPIIYLKKQVVDVVEKGRSDSSSSKGEVCEKEGTRLHVGCMKGAGEGFDRGMEGIGGMLGLGVCGGN